MALANPVPYKAYMYTCETCISQTINQYWMFKWVVCRKHVMRDQEKQ